MNTLAHASGSAALFYLMQYAFNTLAIPALGYAMLFALGMAVLFTAMTAWEEADFIAGRMFRRR